MQVTSIAFSTHRFAGTDFPDNEGLLRKIGSRIFQLGAAVFTLAELRDFHRSPRITLLRFGQLDDLSPRSMTPNNRDSRFGDREVARH